MIDQPFHIICLREFSDLKASPGGLQVLSSLLVLVLLLFLTVAFVLLLVVVVVVVVSLFVLATFVIMIHNLYYNKGGATHPIGEQPLPESQPGRLWEGPGRA